MTDENVEALYDTYLDACYSGGAEEPEAFFARHPGLDTTGRERIRALHRVVTEVSGNELPFEKLGGYKLLRRLGGGGMGTVYLAEQVALRRFVALKVIRPELQASATALKRFEREALAIAKLRHPNAVTIHELGVDGDVRYLAMELVPGRSLREVVLVEKPHLSRVLGWIRQVALALHAAHEQGIVHRDVKPGNILITPEDRAVLHDFGLAHLTEVEATTLTRSFAGSPSYAAPEQLTGAPLDGRTDIYALGVTLYESITGKLPSDASTMEGIFRKVLTEEPAPPQRFNPEIGRAVEIVTLKAMEKRPQDRYASAAEFADDLRALLFSAAGRVTGCSVDELVEEAFVEGDTGGVVPVLESQGRIETSALDTSGGGEAVAARRLVAEDGEQEVLMGDLLLAGEEETLGQGVKDRGESKSPQDGLEVGREDFGRGH